MSDKERLEETLKNPDIEERYLGIIRLLQEDRDQLMKQNKRYREAIKETKNIIEEAIVSLDNNEKVQGLEWAVKRVDEALEGEE